MKECGLWTRNMDKVLIGDKKITNLEENIPEIGLKIKSMEEEHSFSKIQTDTMATG